MELPAAGGWLNCPATNFEISDREKSNLRPSRIYGTFPSATQRKSVLG